MTDLLAYLHGRWSEVPPVVAGLYFMRVGDPTQTYVGHWDPRSTDPSAGRKEPELRWMFFYLEGDPDGRPTRADDPRAVREALARGWKPEARPRDPSRNERRPAP